MADDTAALQWGVAPAQARVLCVFLHGRGQTPEDITQTIIGRLRVDDVHYVLPRAEGKSWYKAHAVDNLTDLTVAQVSAALAQIRSDTLEAIEAGAPGRRLIVAGFSQGACMALEAVLQQALVAKALAVLTGCRVGDQSASAPTAALLGLSAYLSCADVDDWIPLESAARTQVALSAAGARVRSDIFPGRTHGVSDTEIRVLEEMIDAVAEGRAPFETALGRSIG
jgi:phospholipase/carboxylesterase